MSRKTPHSPIDPTTTEPVGPSIGMRGQFSRTAAWAFVLAVLSISAAWPVVWVQRYFSPWLLLPILAGAVWGLLAVWLMRWFQVGSRFLVLTAMVPIALLFVFSNHVVSYRWAIDREQELVRQLPPDQQQALSAIQHMSGQPVDSPSMRAFLVEQADRGRPLWGNVVAQGPLAWLSWTLDALLTAGTAMVVVAVGYRRGSYCGQCRRWRHVSRSGTCNAAQQQQIQTRCDIELPASAGPIQYKLLACRAGCVPECLKLSWSSRESHSGATAGREVWLSAPDRDAIRGQLALKA